MKRLSYVWFIVFVIPPTGAMEVAATRSKRIPSLFELSIAYCIDQLKFPRSLPESYGKTWQDLPYFFPGLFARFKPVDDWNLWYYLALDDDYTFRLVMSYIDTTMETSFGAGLDGDQEVPLLRLIKPHRSTILPQTRISSLPLLRDWLYQRYIGRLPRITVDTQKKCARVPGYAQAHHLLAYQSRKLWDKQGSRVVYRTNESYPDPAYHTGNVGDVLVVDEDNESYFYQLYDHPGYVLSLALNAAGTHALLGGQDNSVFLWDIQKNTSVAVSHHRAPVLAVYFAPGERNVISFGADRAVHISNLDSGVTVRINEYINRKSNLNKLSRQLSKKIVGTLKSKRVPRRYLNNELTCEQLMIATIFSDLEHSSLHTITQGELTRLQAVVRANRFESVVERHFIERAELLKDMVG